MTGPPRDFDCGLLLRHLACELERLADSADRLQEAAAAATGAEGTSRVEDLVMRLQAMDALSQVLRDLQRLAGAASASRFGRCRIEPDFVRRHLLLRSLAERLVTGTDHDHDGAAFLL